MKKIVLLITLLILMSSTHLFAFLNFSFPSYNLNYSELEYHQSNIFGKSAGLSSLGLSVYKLGGNLNTTLKIDSTELYNNKYYAEYFKIGITYKLYDGKEKSKYFVDYCLTSLQNHKRLSKDFYWGTAGSIIKNQTQIYSKNNIDWLEIIFSLKYDLSLPDNGLYIYPSVFLNFGYSEFEFDTINCNVFSNLRRRTQHHLVGTGFNLHTNYNDFTLKYDFNLNFLTDGLMYVNKLELRYDIYAKYFNLLSLFINYQDNNFDLYASSNESGNKIFNSLESFNFGVAIHPFALFSDLKE